MRRLALVTVLFGAAACAHTRAVDLGALVAAHGLDGAADELRFEVASDPRDREALAALGEIEARRAHPGAALDALARAEALGGRPGGGISDDDRARLAALYVARARERAARGASTATLDLERARRLGAEIPTDLARDAELAAALAQLRHSDPRTRAAGRARLAHLAAAAPDDVRFAAAAPIPDRATAALLGRAGVAAAWLWDRGARRAALDAFDAWVGRGGLLALGIAPPPTAPGLATAPAAIAERWLAARAWWNGDAAPADVARARDLGASACAVAIAPGDACSPAAAAKDAAPDGPAWEATLWRRAEARGWRGDDPAWLVLAARAWLRGDAPSYLAAARAHLDPTALDAAPVWARPSLARQADRGAPADRDALLAAALADAPNQPPGPRLVVAVEAALAGRPAADVEAALGPASNADPSGSLTRGGAPHGALGDELLARVRGADPPALPDLAHAAAARASRGEPTAAADADALAAIAAAYLRDPALGDRTADDWIARDVDVAARAPIAAALFAALGDPARARALWQRAADASPGEVRVALGLALAAAGADDPDAAMVFVTGAAAASGDAAPVLTEVARALAARGRYDHALELEKLALQLVPPDDRAPLLDLVIAWSTAEGKDPSELIAARAALPAAAPVAAPPPLPPIEDPDALAAAARLAPRAAAPRVRLLALPTADPRRARALSELAAIAADPRADAADAADAWTAVAAAIAPPPAAPRR